jgi:predicted nucleic acid-binding protein
LKVSYLETSALLSWFFNEPKGADVRKAMNSADLIVTSDLLCVETERAFRRALKEGILSDDEYAALVELFYTHIKEWFRMSIDEAVISRASGEFPVEPVRSLDAIHLATALEYKKLYPQLSFISLDERIEKNREGLNINGDYIRQ